MSNQIFFIAFSIFLMGCQSNDNNQDLKSKFKINGTISENQGFEKVYLSLIVNNNYLLLDSSDIKNNSFQFKGNIAYPKKAQLQFYQNGEIFPFILGGENMIINLTANSLHKSKIKNSPLNDEWNRLKINSQEIYGEVDYLYPVMQKARMQNDFKTLEKINNSIDSIENINRIFLLDYINKNSNSYLSALILNDLFYSAKKDSMRIIETSKKILPELKKALEFDVK
jgi:hypothetical protein